MLFLIAPLQGLAAQGIATTSSEAVEGSGWAARWLNRVSRIQSQQPHWITPLATVTPLLEQEYRFDYVREETGSVTVGNFGGGKGLELIPVPNVELIVFEPSYIRHPQSPAQNGWGNSGFLVKFRLASGNQNHGNYAVTLFFSTSFPTGTNGNGAGHEVYTPTIAVGKGWGNFDVQSTVGAGIPSGGLSHFGVPIAWNTALQYRIAKRIWPEFEINSTFWRDGLNAGKKQIYLTPGLVIGRIPLHNRVGITAGAGIQIATTEFRAYDHALVLSFRLPF